MHIAAASLWIGGLATMAGLAWFGAPQLRRRMFMRFSQLATVLIALVLGAGTYLGIVRLPHLHDLWTASYGRVLLVKIGLVGFALLWGAFHKFVIGPALDRADEGFLTRIGRSLVGESLVGVAVLLVAAMLVDSKPPPRPSGNRRHASPLVQGGAASRTREAAAVSVRAVSAARSGSPSWGSPLPVVPPLDGPRLKRVVVARRPRLRLG